MWWHLVDHPAIAHLHWQDRERLGEAAQNRYRHQPRVWVGAFIPSLPFWAFLLLLLNRHQLAPLMQWVVWAVLLLITVEHVWSIFAMRRRLAAALGEQLLEEGIRPCVCLVCGYDLRGTDSDRCSECGAELRRERDRSECGTQ